MIDEVKSTIFSEETKGIFRSWEFLRIVYNAILFVLSILMIWDLWPKVLVIPVLMNATLAAIAANICFFLGPITESYLNWLGWKPKKLRSVLFVLGMILSATIVICIIGAMHFQFELVGFD